MNIDFMYRVENSTIQSRIDCIYIQDNLLKYTYDWRIERISIETDHRIISMNITNPWMPYQGPGRYAMPLFLMNHKPLERKVHELGDEYYSKIREARAHRTKDFNPQKVHKELKHRMINMI